MRLRYGRSGLREDRSHVAQTERSCYATFDFAPFYRSTVGFDRLFSMLDQVGGVESAAAPGYPPYNIKRSGENAYNISLAVAGFAGADLSIEVKDHVNDPRQQAEQR